MLNSPFVSAIKNEVHRTWDEIVPLIPSGLLKTEGEAAHPYEKILESIYKINDLSHIHIPTILPQQTGDLTPKSQQNKKKIRIYMDGVFDLMHSGHFNAMRQAKQLGDELVIGMVSDEDCIKNKGPPVLNMKERVTMAKACKWVDEVVEGVPYDATVELLEKFNCDYNAHGDDIALNAEGVDSNKLLKDAGKMRIFKRTEGISTTDIVGRLLLLTKVHLVSLSIGT